MPRSAGDRAWAVWLAATLASFGALETLALRRRTLPTLSTTLRRWLGIHPRTRWGTAAPLAFAAFWTWLTVHLTRRVADAVDEHL